VFFAVPIMPITLGGIAQLFSTLLHSAIQMKYK